MQFLTFHFIAQKRLSVRFKLNTSTTSLSPRPVNILTQFGGSVIRTVKICVIRTVKIFIFKVKFYFIYKLTDEDFT